MYQQSKFKFLIILFLSLAFLAGIFLLSTQDEISPVEAADQSLFGYAWSSNIGWLKFRGMTQDGFTYGVSLDDVTGELSGYAWSSNIGWINFSPTGPYPENPQQGAKLENDKVVGWARAITGEEPFSGGWDGWIKMSGTASDSSDYGVSFADCNFTGYAWGSDIIGWISFSGSTYGVSLSSCVVTKDQPNCSFSASPDTITSPQNSSTLYWSCEPDPLVDSCYISEGVGGVASAGGNQTVTVNETTLFILICRTSEGALSILPATVEVIKQPKIIEVLPR